MTTAVRPVPRYLMPDLKFPPWDTMAVHQGMPYFLCGLVSVMQPKLVVEAGTYRGHTALAIASTLRSLQCGHLHTADPLDHGAKAMLTAQGLDPWATAHLFPYEEMLVKVAPQGGIDLAFIDASGSPEDGTMRMRHFAITYDRLVHGGMIVMDDIAATDWPYVNTLRDMAQVYLPGLRGIAIFQRRRCPS